MSNTSFHFTSHHDWVSCIIIELTINAMTVTITIKGQHWRLLIYALHNFSLRNNVTCFQKQPPLFLKLTNSTGEHLCWNLLFFAWNDEIIWRNLSFMNKGGSPFSEFESHKWHNSLANISFFILHLRRTKCSVYSTNLLFLRTRKKQPLKCLRQISYQDLWPYTLYIIWQGAHPLVK